MNSGDGSQGPTAVRALRIPLMALACLVGASGCSENSEGSRLPDKGVVLHRIAVDLPGPLDNPGGILAADLDNDGARDLVVTAPGFVGAYAVSGETLWTRAIDIQVSSSAEKYGLPGIHAPGVAPADPDGDGRVELLLLTEDSALAVLDGATGEVESRIPLPSPPGTEGWEHLVVADFRGQGDRDLLLQATNTKGYRFGRFLAAYPLDTLIAEGSAEPLWTRNDFLGAAHAGARIADLDGDGRHEVLGGAIVGPEGNLLTVVPIRGHVDGIEVADIRPDIPGLEVVALEEGGSYRVFLYNTKGLIWEADNEEQEPQNAAVGEFDLNRPGLEIWCRSRYNAHQKPWVFDAKGNLIAAYEMDNVAPEGWSTAGVEVISTIDWTGEARQLAAAKERHTSGDVAIFDPISGTFLHRFDTEAARLYVADVTGDWREELIVLTDEEVRIYENAAPNPRPDHPRLWERDDYRRSKTTWNYYNT